MHNRMHNPAIVHAKSITNETGEGGPAKCEASISI
jgi:hypothetical protein